MSKQEKDESENLRGLPPYPNLEVFTLNDFQLVSPPNDKPHVLVSVRPDAAEYIHAVSQAWVSLGYMGTIESPMEQALSHRKHLIEKNSRFLEWAVRETVEHEGLLEEEEIKLRAELAETLSNIPFPDEKSANETKQRVHRKAAEDLLSEICIIATVRGIIGLGFSKALQKEHIRLSRNSTLEEILKLINGYMDQPPRFVVIDGFSGEEIFKIPQDLMTEKQSTS